MLAGLLVDFRGARLTSSHATKGGRRYRYYVGVRVEEGQSKAWRLPAHEIEATVIRGLQWFLADRQRVADALASQPLKAHELKEALWTAKEIATRIGQASAPREIVTKLVNEIRVSASEIVVHIQLAALMPEGAKPPRNEHHRLSIPAELRRQAGEDAIVVSAPSSPETKADPTLVKAIACGSMWFEELATGRIATVTAIVRREGVTDRYVSQMLDLTFLSPRIVEKVLRARGMFNSRRRTSSSISRSARCGPSRRRFCGPIGHRAEREPPECSHAKQNPGAASLRRPQRGGGLCADPARNRQFAIRSSLLLGRATQRSKQRRTEPRSRQMDKAGLWRRSVSLDHSRRTVLVYETSNQRANGHSRHRHPKRPK